MTLTLLTEHHLEFLRLKGGCTGLSASTHVKIPNRNTCQSVRHYLTNSIISLCFFFLFQPKICSLHYESKADTNNNVIKIINPLEGSFHEESEQRTFSCEFCLRKYRKQANLETHLTTHTRMQFVCRACHYSFMNQEQLVEHNNKKDSHLCDQCGRVFGTKHNLKEHKLAVHKVSVSPLRMFRCSLPSCSKSFFRRVHLESHINTKHTGEKPYNCEKCLKRFESRTGMARHMSKCDKGTNNGPKFECKECNSSFKQRGSLKNYIDAIHKVSTATCPKCSKVF